MEKHGITLEAVPLPMSSSYITRAEYPEIMLGKSPERDRAIDNICQMIRNCKRAGIPMVKYNLTILGVVRSEPTPGRGAAMYSTFNYEKAKRAMFPPLTEAGPVSAEQGVGAHRLLPAARGAGGDRGEGEDGLPPPRSRDAGNGRLPRCPSRAGQF